jgi:hypothetical protein
MLVGRRRQVKVKKSNMGRKQKIWRGQWNLINVLKRKWIVEDGK